MYFRLVYCLNVLSSIFLHLQFYLQMEYKHLRIRIHYFISYSGIILTVHLYFMQSVKYVVAENLVRSTTGLPMSKAGPIASAPPEELSLIHI